MQEVILKIRYFEKGLQKSFKKVNVIFSPNPVPFNEKRYQKRRPGTSDQSLFRL